MFKITGTVQYDPARGEMNVRAQSAIELFNMAMAEFELAKNAKQSSLSNYNSVETAIRDGVFAVSDEAIDRIAHGNKLTKTQLLNAFARSLEDQGFRRKALRSGWWCVVNVSPEITRYYRWLTCKTIPGLRLYAPSWDAHVTVIRGERPPASKMHLWKAYQGKRVEMWMNCEVQFNRSKATDEKSGTFYFIEVESNDLTNIRAEFGFPTNWKHHLTIGRTWDNGAP